MNVRAITDADLETVAELAATDEAALLGRPSQIGSADIRGWMRRVDMENDTWLYEEGGRLVAAAWLEQADDLGVFVGIVARGAKGRGLGRTVAEAGEQRARDRGATRLHAVTLEPDTAAGELFARRGYAAVRRFYEMAIELEAAPDAPPLGDGFALDVFRTEDAKPFYDTLEASFQDHWEHHSIGFERWWEEKQRNGFDPTLWFLVRAGGEVAGAIQNEAGRNGGGYVATLGVVRAWRGKGIARALLLHTFAEFYARGVPRVTLGVDAENPTGATKLYESVGMVRDGAAVVYEKALT